MPHVRTTVLSCGALRECRQLLAESAGEFLRKRRQIAMGRAQQHDVELNARREGRITMP
jgi:hypothetical protein